MENNNIQITKTHLILLSQVRPHASRDDYTEVSGVALAEASAESGPSPRLVSFMFTKATHPRILVRLHGGAAICPHGTHRRMGIQVIYKLLMGKGGVLSQYCAATPTSSFVQQKPGAVNMSFQLAINNKNR